MLEVEIDKKFKEVKMKEKKAKCPTCNKDLDFWITGTFESVTVYCDTCLKAYQFMRNEI